jgi:hypothetical protein
MTHKAVWQSDRVPELRKPRLAAVDRSRRPKTESPGKAVDTEALHCGADIPTPRSYCNVAAARVS